MSGGRRKGAKNRGGQRAKRGRGRRDVGLGAHLQLAMRSGVIADPRWLRVAQNRTHAAHIYTVCSQWFSAAGFLQLPRFDLTKAKDCGDQGTELVSTLD